MAPETEPPDPELRLLGPLDLRTAGESVPIEGTRQRIVLAMLLLEAGRVLPIERLISAVWDDDPPATARTQVHNSISKLRGRLATRGLPGAIVTHESGYLIRVPDDALDLARFRALVATGREAARRREVGTAVATLRAALGVWRGRVAAGIRSRLVQSAALRIEEERLAVAEECLGLELELGHHHEVIGELRELVAAQPLREKLYQSLMLALYRDGRQAEALEVYREVRRVLVEEHGLDPGEQLRALERAILDDDSVLAPASEAALPVPRQLPAPAKDFVGRGGTVTEIQRALLADGPGEVVVVSGPPGVGKTALALHTAYGVAERFPDGQLYAHLRGSDSRPVRPEQVLDRFLSALEVAPETLSTDPVELATLYRSRLAGRRVLVFLDDAAGAWQVEPLLLGRGGAAGVTMIVTSRGALPGLPGARRFDLKVFTPETSRLLLSRVVGPARVRAEPEAAGAVAQACGHLPLALQIAAAKLAVRPHWRVTRMARRLGDESKRLDELSLEGTEVRATIAVSVEALGAPALRLLPLLGSLGAVDFAGWVAGPLLDLDPEDGADVLDELVDARLAEVQSGTGHRARYRLHELVGVFARELLAARVSAGDRTAAQHRLLRCWLFLARQAHQREYGGDFTVLHADASPWPLPAEVVDELVAYPMEWFESEHPNLVAAVRLAAELQLADLCWDLAVTSVTFFEARGHREDWRQTHELALAAARQSGDERGEAAVRCSRAGLALVEHRFADAFADLSAALRWFVQAGDAHGRGLTLRGLASIDRLQGRYQRAQEQYEQALADLRSAGDQVAAAHVLINLAQVHTDGGSERAAETMLRQALEICTGTPARRVVAQARYRLGQLYLGQGELTKAEAELTAVLTTVTASADPVGTAHALRGIGAVRLAGGHFDQARESLSEALAKARQAGSRLGTGQALLTLAELSLHAGEPSMAAEKLDEAERAFSEIGATTWLERVGDLRRRLPGSEGVANQ